MTYRFFVLLTLALVLAATAWTQEIQNPAVTVPTPPAGFQNPYKYTPPPISFVPNAPWSANVKADSMTTSNPPDGALVVSGQGKAVASYNQYISNFQWQVSVTTNGGATWTPATPHLEGTQFDNVLGSNHKDSTICLVMRSAGGGYNDYFIRSTNSGVTWSDTFHVPQAATGTFPDHPIMATRYPNILVTHYDAGGNGYEEIVRSTNWGNTWNSSQIYLTTSSTCQGGCPAFDTGSSNVAYAAWGQPASWQPSTIWFNKSTNLGATWGTPQQILALGMSSHLPSMRPTHTFPSMVVAPNGTIYLTVMDMLHSSGWDIAFIKSTNGGTTWSTPVQVNDDVSTPNDDCFDNWMCVDRFNRPHVFWTDNRNYYNNGSGNEYGCDIYYSYSLDGGATWRPNEQVNDVTPIASTSGDFSEMGDYQQIDCDSTKLYCEWSDHRNAHHSWSYIATATRSLPSGVEEQPTVSPWVNSKFSLAPSKPNPVMTGTELAFQLEQSSQASLRVYDLTGKLVKTVLNGSLFAGSHSARWDGRDSSGKPVPSGVYFYRLESGGLTATQKLVVAR